MVTWTARVAAFTIDEEPRPEEEVELLCEDHCGTYLLPFPCRRVGREWHNQTTGQIIEVTIVGWRTWKSA